MLTREEVMVRGITTAVYSDGAGDALVYLHGASTVGGFAFLEPLTDQFKVIVPMHPGFADSGDDPTIASVADYVMHYIELFDQLGLDRFHLVGQSLGGFIAARFAVSHADRLRRLVLSSPVGLRVPSNPTTDVFSIRPAELAGFLTAEPSLLAERAGPITDPDELVARYRESVSSARVLWERNWDPALSRWLFRVSVPTLLLWGDEDRIVPVEQAEVWASELPDATVQILAGHGHLLMQEGHDALEHVRRFCSAATVGA